MIISFSRGKHDTIFLMMTLSTSTKEKRRVEFPSSSPHPFSANSATRDQFNRKRLSFSLKAFTLDFVFPYLQRSWIPLTLPPHLNPRVEESRRESTRSYRKGKNFSFSFFVTDVWCDFAFPPFTCPAMRQKWWWSNNNHCKSEWVSIELEGNAKRRGK